MPRRLFTEEEYLLIERAAGFKSEYLDGGIYAMAGAGLPHGQIIANISGVLYNQFRGRPCSSFTNDLRVRVAASGLYTYPDVVAFCGAPRMSDERKDTLLNPQLIIEVLSPSTASYDRGEKWDRYRQLESLTDYILVEQEQMSVRHWSRQGDHTWKVMDYNQPSDQVFAEAISVQLTLADIYEHIVFPPRVVPPAR